MMRWYVVRTKPSREALAELNLKRQGYEVYLPRVLQALRRQGRWGDFVRPLFPRYLFLQLREGFQALNPVRSSIGVADIVRFGARYAILPDQIINELRLRADPKSGYHALGHHSHLVHGARVRIVTGPFEGIDGIFERQAGSARVILLLAFLGQEAPVCVPAAFVAMHSAA